MGFLDELKNAFESGSGAAKNGNSGSASAAPRKEQAKSTPTTNLSDEATMKVSHVWKRDTAKTEQNKSPEATRPLRSRATAPARLLQGALRAATTNAASANPEVPNSLQGTARGTLAKINDLYATNPEAAKAYYNKYTQETQTASSPYFAPYSSPTNQAVSQLAELGVDVSNIDDAFYSNYSWLKDHYVYTANTNSLSSSMTGKRATREQKAAYAYNQMWEAEDTTKAAETELADLKKEIDYWVHSGLGLSDEEIIQRLNISGNSKYKTLAKMDEGRLAGTPIELNRAVNYNGEDDLYTYCWQARNNGGTGDFLSDKINSAYGSGNVWQADDALISRRTPGSDGYAPYSLGAVGLDDVGMRFGVYSFEPDWLSTHEYLLNGSDDDVKAYQKVYAAEETTLKAEDELKKLNEFIDRRISRCKSVDELLGKIDWSDYPTLAAMNKSVGVDGKPGSGKLLSTTRKIDYSYGDMKQDIADRIADYQGKATDLDYATSVAKDASTPADELTEETPDQTEETPAGKPETPASPDPEDQDLRHRGTFVTLAKAAELIGVAVQSLFGPGEEPKVENIPEDEKEKLRDAYDEEYGDGAFDRDTAEPETPAVEGTAPEAEGASKTGASDTTASNVGTAPLRSDGLNIVATAGPVNMLFLGGTPVTEQEKKIIEAQNTTLFDAIDAAEGVMTPAEKKYIEGTGGVTYDRLTASLREVKSSMFRNDSQLLSRAMKSSARDTISTTLQYSNLIAEYEQNSARVEALQEQERGLADKLGDLIYNGQNVPFNVQSTVHVGDKDVNVSLSLQQGYYALSDMWDPETLDVVSGVDKAELDKAVQEAISQANDFYQSWERGNSRELTEEESADLEQYRKISEELNGRLDTQKQGAEEYEEARAATDRAQRNQQAILSMLRDAGADTTQMENMLVVADYFQGFAQYDPTVWDSYSVYDEMARLLDGPDGQNYTGMLEQAGKEDAQVQEALAVNEWALDYADRMGIKLPDGYRENMERYSDELRRTHDDFSYVSMLANEDYDEKSQAGLKHFNQLKDQGLDWDAFAESGGSLENQPLWAFLTDEQKESLNGIAEQVNTGAAGIDLLDNTIRYMANELDPETRIQKMLGIGPDIGNILTFHEEGLYYYLLETQGATAANKYWDHLANDAYGMLNSRISEGTEEIAREIADQGFWGRRAADIFSMALSPIAAINSGIYFASETFKKITGQKTEFNPNNAKLWANAFKTSARDEIQKEIDKVYADKPLAKQIFSTLQEMVSNRGDSMVNALAFGWMFDGITNDIAQEFMGSIPMATEAAASAAADAKDRGASDTQAYGVAAATLIAEAATEAISLENIKEAFGSGMAIDTADIKGFLKNWLTKAGVSEAFGETLNDVIENQLTDRMIMKNLSKHSQRVAELTDGGMTKEDAEAQVWQEELGDILHTALVSYLSPGLDIASFGVGRISAYREETRRMQQNGFNVSILDVMRMEREGRKSRKNERAAAGIGSRPVSRAEAISEIGDRFMPKPDSNGTSAEQTTTASAEGAGTAVSENGQTVESAETAPAEAAAEATTAERAEAETTSETPAEAPAETPAESAAKDFEILESSKDSGEAEQTASVSAVLDTDTAPVRDLVVTSEEIADAAAVRMSGLFGDGITPVQGMQELITGAFHGKVSPVSVKQALQNAAMSENSAAYKMMQSPAYQNASPEVRAQMLASTIESDSQNQQVLSDIAGAIRENRVAAETKKMLADGALESVQEAQEAAETARQEADAARDELEKREAAVETAQDKLQVAGEEAVNNPSDENTKEVIQASEELDHTVTVRDEYQQHLDKAEQKEQAAKEKLKGKTDDTMREVRAEAEARVDQEDQRRAEQKEQEAQAAEQARTEAEARQAEEDERSGKTWEENRDALIESLLDQEYLEEGEERDKRRAELTERANQIKLGRLDMAGLMNNTEGYLAVSAIGRRLNMGIELSDSLPGGTRGMYKDGKVYLNADLIKKGKMTVGQALVEASLHEITHAMERTKNYQKYRDTVLKALFGSEAIGNTDELYSKNARFRAAVDQKISDYSRSSVHQELSREDAEREIVADFARTRLNEREVVQRFMDAGLGGRMRNALHNINQALQNFRLKGQEKQTAEYLRRAERTFQKMINEEAKTAVHPEGGQFSVAQIAQATGMTFDDKTLTLRDAKGNVIDGVNNKITADMIGQTPVGLLIDNGLTGKQNSDAKEMMAGLMNMVARYKDSNLVWEIGATTLSSTFSALKSNSDPQYATTVDFGTVCAKTQAIIDVMSQVMLDRVKEGKSGGLTREEIMKVYNETHNAGLSVPCPVCYVFSRWMGVPSLLGQMSQYQNDYVVKNEDGSIDRKATQERVDKYIQEAEAKYGDAKAINNAKTKLQNRRAILDERLSQTMDKEERNSILKEMVDLDNKIGEVSAYNWITQALCKKEKGSNKYVVDPKFKLTPDEILFDLNRTGEFAEYEKNWRYRNTRGAGMGKAIMPYSGETIGDILYGVKSSGRQTSIKNPWLNMDEKAAARQLKNARDRARKQNLVGGQRLQSTSDFRPEWGLDYIMSFLELQAAGSKTQMYTKVPDAVDFFASVGADVNLSIMGKGQGWHEDENGNKVLDFSSITGMDYETAKALKNKYDNVQMILVGMNDTHIRLAMANKDIDFIIPWHSSGNSKDVLAGLIASVGEKLDSSVDYSSTQTDSVSESRTAEQKALWDARLKLLNKGGNALNQEERATLLSNPFTADLYRRFTEKGVDDDCYGVKLSKSQAEQIFPYEYWDTTSTKENADINGKRFAEYCEAMGIVPRFSQFKNDPGYWKLLIDRPMYNNDGSYHRQQVIDVTKARIGSLNDGGQLTDSDLPTSAQAKYKPTDPRSEHYAEYTERERQAIENAKASIDGGRQYDDGTSGQFSVYGDTTTADMEQMLSQTDEDYRSAVERGDLDAAAQDVESFAEGKGYTDRAYHGTNVFGFTEFDPSVEDQIFVAYDEQTAGTYTRDKNVRPVSEGSSFNYTELLADNDKMAALAKEKLTSLYGAPVRDVRFRNSAELRQMADSMLQERILKPLEGVEWESEEVRIGDIQAMAQRTGADESYLEQASTPAELERLLYELYANEINSNDQTLLTGDKIKQYLSPMLTFRGGVSPSETRGMFWDMNQRLIDSKHPFGMFEFDIANRGNIPVYYDQRWVLDHIVEANGDEGGIYSLYTRPGNQLVVDANGSRWNQISVDWQDRTMSTRDIAQYANENGYDSVRINNVRDNGNYREEGVRYGESDIGIFFNQNDVKSADPVTRDDHGNMIPLSERFSDSSDIRYLANAVSLTDLEQYNPEYMKPFAEQLHDFAPKETRKKIFGKDSLLVGPTPELMQRIGFPALPVVINQEHAGYAIDGDYPDEKYRPGHTFSEEEFAKLPEKIADPIAITYDPRSTKQFTVYVDMVNTEGDKVIAPFRIGASRNIGGKNIQANALLTVFENQDGESNLMSAIRNDSENNHSLLYLNKEKALGLDLAYDNITIVEEAPSGINHIINAPDSLVNTEIQDQIQTKQFTNWFKGSKITNEDGTPMVVYHGTSENFTAFDMNKGRSTMDIQGAFFSPWEIEASGYGENVGAYYLSIKNPAPENIAYAALRRFQGQNEAGKKAKEYLKSLGYDGAVYGEPGNYEEIIAFDPRQIKSATGNIGLFDRQNPDTRYSANGETTLADLDRQLVQAGALTQEDVDSYNGITPPTNGLSTNVNPEDNGPGRRQFGTQTAQESDALHQEVKDYLYSHSSYTPDSNAAQIDRAIGWVQQHANGSDQEGYYSAVQEVESSDFDYRSADGQARMLTLMGMAALKGDIATEMRLADAYNRQGTDLGQQLQARKMFRLMTPLGRRMTLEQEAARINQQFAEKGSNRRVELPPLLLMAAEEAQSEDDFDKVRRAAAKELAAQMPANWKEKLTSWRMLSMLGNPRTHIRNILGNAIFMPAVGIKNKIGAVGEIVTGQKERTKTLGFASSAARSFAKADAAQMEAILRGDAKYKDGSQVQQERKAFGQGSSLISRTLGQGLQALSDFNSNMLEAEDWIFLARHYRNALAGYMTANKLTAADMTGETLEKARAYAVAEAQKATYRDANKVASALNKIGREGGAMGFVVNAVLPFKKTPANILKRGVEYSPVGLMNALTRGARQVKMWNDFQSGKLSALPEKAISPTQWIDKIASGLTGTAITALGFLLAGAGAVSAGFGDDEDELEKLDGRQEYSLNLKLFGEDVSFTIDWAAPVCMPFFVGATIFNEYQKQSKGDEIDYAGIADSILGITEPVFNLSMLDGVNSLLDVSQYAEGNAITQIGEKIVTNYATSYIPTFVGQVARTMDTTRRKSYVESGASLSTFRYALEQSENKLPWLSKTNIPYRDVWGNADISSTGEAAIENFISPGYFNRVKNDPVVAELKRLYQAGEKAVLPKTASKSVSISGQTIKLNAEQYDQYVVDRGQKARDTLEALMESPLWQVCDDSTRADLVADAWTYANQLARHNLDERADVAAWILSADVNGNVVDAIIDRAVERNQKDYITGHGQSLAEALDAEDAETYYVSLQALEDAGASKTQIKGALRDYFKPLYQAAFLRGDQLTMAEIEDKLLDTDAGFKDKDFTGWLPGAEEEEDEDPDRYQWLSLNNR